MTSIVESHTGSIRFHVQDIRALTGTVASPEVIVGRIRWWLTGTRTNTTFGIHLHCACQPSHKFHFRARTIYHFLLISSNQAPFSARSYYTAYDGSRMGANVFCHWTQFEYDHPGFVASDGSALIDARFAFDLFVLPEFTEQRSLFDTPVTVDNRVFYVNREEIAMVAPHLKELLYGDDEKTNIVLSGVSPETFLAFLHIVHCPWMTATEDTVEDLLRFSDAPIVRETCDAFLYESVSAFPLALRLTLAEKYNLPISRHRCRLEVGRSSDVLKGDRRFDYKSFDSNTIANACKAASAGYTLRRDANNTNAWHRKQTAATCVFM